jgi:hypothetical protein
VSNAINLWGGEKGGTGKSWGARLDCQRYLDRAQDFFLIDTDKSNATTSNYYGKHKFDKQAFFSEAIERASTANSLLDAALLRPVVANCRAGTNESLLTWLVTKKVMPTALRLGIRMRYLFVSDLDNDSLNLFAPTAETIGQYMPMIFVANAGRNTTDLEFFESDGFQGLLSQYRVPVVRLGLFDLEMKKVVDGRNPQKQLLTWGEARDYPDFGILGQQEIQTYLEDFYAQLERAERLADSAFSERFASKDANGQETETLPNPPSKRNSRNG